METWDLVLLVVAGYVGTMTLIRLMIHRRDQMIEKLRKEVEKERRRKMAGHVKDQRERGRRGEAA